jgi:hypothetical protein
MNKSHIVLACMILLLTLALLIPLVGCNSSKTITTPTSGETLSYIYGGGKNLGDVRLDAVSTLPQLPQTQTVTIYYKNFGVANETKYREDLNQANTTVLMDCGTQTGYVWYRFKNLAYKINMSQGPRFLMMANATQIHPTYIGTDTVDGHLCDVWQYTIQVTEAGQVTGADTATEKVWIWKDKSFPVKLSETTSSGTTTAEYQNIVFGALPDSLFELPATVQVQQ